MGKGISWVDGVIIFSSDSSENLRERINSWIEAHSTYNIKAIRFNDDKYTFSVLVHYQKPKDWE
jgi:hypothetical protein